MADINQIITLGIGPPSGIPEFLTLGLQISAAVAVTPAVTLTLALDSESAHSITLDSESAHSFTRDSESAHSITLDLDP